MQQWSLFLASPFGENKLLCVRPQCLGGCHECAPALLLGDAIRRLAFYYLAAMTASHGLGFRTAKDGKV